MRIAIIDDERPARGELRMQLSELIPEAEILEASSGETAMTLISEHVFDILFIDINLGDVAGTTVASAVQRIMPEARIVFVTAYSQYAVEAFDLGVTDYVLKPFDKVRLEKMLDRCGIRQDDSARELSKNKLAVRSSRHIVLLDIPDIVFIETDNRGSVIHTKDNSYFENQTIGMYEKKLEGRQFFRIHKSYLVNLDMVSELIRCQAGSFAVKLRGREEELPVSREKVKDLHLILNI